ncbi:MAG: TetR/AcrR family transcriptional regulator [Spirochaetales bacterium]|nr:TetR/AcrR family transcriptional regulator [Spirochaetales bacterium]
MSEKTADVEKEPAIKILDAAIEEFNSKGLKFTMDDLALRLSMSKKTLYKYYKDKETLFLKMVDRCFSAIKESEKIILNDSELSIAEKIKRIVIVLPEKYTEIDLRRLWELKDTYPEVYLKVSERIENDWEPTLNLIKQGINSGAIRPVSLPVFKMIVESTIEHFLSNKTLLDKDIKYSDALNEMIDILMYGIKA